jgi:hypothetical protein
VIIWIRKLVSLKENSLRDTRILNSRLDNMDSIIIKVVVDDALSDSVVLIWILDNWLLEISMEA